MDVWLSKQELATKLRCSVRTVERHYVPTMRVGNMNRYLLSHIEAQSAGQDDLPDNVIPLRPARREVAA